MKRNTYIRRIVCLAFLCLPVAHAANQETSAVNPHQAVENYGRLPLSFEANQGQTDRQPGEIPLPRQRLFALPHRQ
jgi:hypothetical protein